MLTDDDRVTLESMAISAILRCRPMEAASIRAALDTIAAQAADVSASRAQLAEAADVIAALRRTRDEQAAELELLRPLAECRDTACSACETRKDRWMRGQYGGRQ